MFKITRVQGDEYLINIADSQLFVFVDEGHNSTVLKREDKIHWYKMEDGKWERLVNSDILEESKNKKQII
jgi:prolyl oligopeptidase PreP (S9A serine peptidase family)